MVAQSKRCWIVARAVLKPFDLLIGECRRNVFIAIEDGTTYCDREASFNESLRMEKTQEAAQTVHYSAAGRSSQPLVPPGKECIDVSDRQSAQRLRAV